jgi:hypothetical protein
MCIYVVGKFPSYFVVESIVIRQSVAMNYLSDSARMGPILLAEVERQLLVDLAHYGVSQPNLKIDWSDACGEGHCTRYLDGNLEELSGLGVVAASDGTIAEGWLDFVRGGDDFPLFVFWLFLSIRANGKWKKVKGAGYPRTRLGAASRPKQGSLLQGRVV